MFEKLTFRSVTARSVLVPLRRPVVSKVGLFDQWPIILIDLATEEGIVGRSYLEPYLKHSARYIVSAIHDLAEPRKGQAIRPLEDFHRLADNFRPGAVTADQSKIIAFHGIIFLGTAIFAGTGMLVFRPPLAN